MANGVVSNTRPCPDIAVISGGIPSIYLPTQISTLRFTNCTHSYSNNILDITPITSGGGGGVTYTAGVGIAIDNSNVITNTKPMAIVSLDGVSYPDVSVLQLNGFTTSTSNANTTLSIAAPTPLTAGTNIEIANDVINCLLAPLSVSLDSTSYTPTGLDFVGFTATESAGTVTINAPSVAQSLSAGTNIEITNDVINCTLAALNVISDGTSHTPSSIKFNNFITSVD